MSAETLPPRPLPSNAQPAVSRFLEQNGPLVDVRSPSEFAQGHLPGAINLPLFGDDERAAVGTLYKQQGRQQAVLQGLALVGPRLEAMAQQLLALATPHAGRLRLYCWRGGMRSASVAWLAGTVGLQSQLLPGGYKAFRSWTLAQFEQRWPLLLLGGRTGSGKTDLLLALRQQGAAVIDLEGLAHHRGSSFGGLGQQPQPSSEHFENRLAMALQSHVGLAPIWLEAESAQVGRCRIPAGLWRQMQKAAVVELQRPCAERVQRLVAVYGSQDGAELAEATRRIAKRLGPQRTALALECIAAGDMAGACRQMLDYYDRCYDHELKTRTSKPLLVIEGSGQSEAALAAQLWPWQQGRAWRLD
ncbi:MAG: tRNA 2-selenouridine(34) synthase MnmH [Cyanobacteria bacterium K_Offshore_0m_m2_072]|nr:tRNA 2-selenouridine(34) synthase MnmH [Cyanobacteria bacterium K_Offshore_0m_m2_072]